MFISQTVNIITIKAYSHYRRKNKGDVLRVPRCLPQYLPLLNRPTAVLNGTASAAMLIFVAVDHSVPATQTVSL